MNCSGLHSGAAIRRTDRDRPASASRRNCAGRSQNNTVRRHERTKAMDIALTLLMIIVAWRVLCLRYQRTHIGLLAAHLANLRLERHMETLTQGYSRAIREETESRQLQVLDTFSQTERAVAAQAQTLADAMQKESA